MMYRVKKYSMLQDCCAKCECKFFLLLVVSEITTMEALSFDVGYV